LLLGVNIDHIAVLREARRVNSPNLIDAVSIVERSGADQITIHLREDRRHIVDKDVSNILENSILPINLELSLDDKILEIASDLKPHRATIVPEKRKEVTTEGGLGVSENFERIENAIELLQENEIEVSLFIDPTIESVKLSKRLGANWIELHTGKFANIYAMLYSNLGHSHHSIDIYKKMSRKELKNELDRSIWELKESASFAKSLGLRVAGGHGLNYQNLKIFREIEHIEEVNIGQSIIARSVFVGLERAILEIKELL
jgi:pyridoxine 5-phosphate synthase